MPTDAQIEANRKNALASTGPKTPEGKSISSRNAVSHGLFCTRDILNPGNPNEQNELAELTAALHQQLAPEGILEQTLAHEITRAIWRLRRCSKVEDSLTDIDPFTDPMANAATAKTQIAVDRARLQTHTILHRCTAELRRLQTERRFRSEILPDDGGDRRDDGGLGLTSFKQLVPALVAEKRLEILKRKLVEDSSAPPTKQTQSAQTAIPRNAPCPCGSGQKHKRCCGKNAPPVVNSAFAQTAA